MDISRRDCLASLLSAPAVLHAADDSTGWVPLFDGKTLTGWKAGDERSFRVVDGQIVADGARSHLFYQGSVCNSEFRNFEFKAEFLSKPGANSGICFHTHFVPAGWPSRGFEVQINATHVGEGQYRERKKTGSLYAVRNIYKAFATDNQWNEMYIAVRGKQVQIRLNGMLLVDYVEPENPPRSDPEFERVLRSGTFALQCHDEGSKVFFRNIRVRPLADDIHTISQRPPAVDDVYREWMRLGTGNMPLVDYHVHLKGLTIDDALAHARQNGFMYGIAVNCGLNFPVRSDAGVREFVASLKGSPVFVAIQGEGREWVRLVSKETLGLVDYCFSDAMTFSDDRGRRMRIWIKDEVGPIEDRQQFMDLYVSRILGVVNDEPIDIHANPTFLPDEIAPAYDELWTTERMSKVIEAAVKKSVAIEINNRYRIPGPEFLKLAKQAGAKFSFGTNNAGAALGRMEYAQQMVKQCGLTWRDIFVPNADGNRSTRA